MQITHPAQWEGVVHAHPESASVSLAGQALRVTWEENGLMEGSKDGRAKSEEKGWWGVWRDMDVFLGSRGVIMFTASISWTWPPRMLCLANPTIPLMTGVPG